MNPQPSQYTKLFPHIFLVPVFYSKSGRKMMKYTNWEKTCDEWNPCVIALSTTAQKTSVVFFLWAPLKYRTPDPKIINLFQLFDPAGMWLMFLYSYMRHVTSRHPGHWTKCAADEPPPLPQPEIVELSASIYINPPIWHRWSSYKYKEAEHLQESL